MLLVDWLVVAVWSVYGRYRLAEKEDVHVSCTYIVRGIYRMGNKRVFGLGVLGYRSRGKGFWIGVRGIVEQCMFVVQSSVHCVCGVVW